MQHLNLTVDFNGIILFDPTMLEGFYEKIEPGENLYSRFTRTNDGDAVVEQGVITPILGLNDSIYRIILRYEHEQSPVSDRIIFSNGEFPLAISDQAVITDMASLLEWNPIEDWQRLDVPAGKYAVTINGFRLVENNTVTDFGFEIVFRKTDHLPAVTGSLSTNMQVLELPS